jgi:hypothetical protein
MEQSFCSCKLQVSSYRLQGVYRCYLMTLVEECDATGDDMKYKSPAHKNYYSTYINFFLKKIPHEAGFFLKTHSWTFNIFAAIIAE